MEHRKKYQQKNKSEKFERKRTNNYKWFCKYIKGL